MANNGIHDNRHIYSGKNSRFVSVIPKVIKILEKFADNYEKRLNFTKLAHKFNLTSYEVDYIITAILNFQELFVNTFEHYRVRKEIKDNQVFLVTEPKLANNIIPKKIRLLLPDFNLLSDVIYMFKFVKRGNGFDIKTNGTELLSNIKELWNYHPYFFEQNENGLMYPSEFGVKLGELILSYKKSSKVIETIQLDEHIIMVVRN